MFKRDIIYSLCSNCECYTYLSKDKVFRNMKEKKVLVLLSFFIAMTCSCKSDNNESFELIRIQLDNTKTTLALSSLFEGMDVILLESGPNNLIGQVRNIIFTEELIIVFDNLQERLFCFDRSGTYRYSVNSQGDGPMEYVSITDFTINELKNTIEIYSFKQGKLVGYDLRTGEPLYNKKFSYFLREFTWLSTNEYLVYSPDIVNNDLDGNLIEKGSFFVSSEDDFLRHLDISKEQNYAQPMNVLSGYGDYALLVPSYSQKVYEFVNGEFRNDYALEVPDSQVDLGYAAPLSVSGTVSKKLLEYGTPEGSVKTVLIDEEGEISDFLYFKNDIFNFPLKPQFVDKDGSLIDLLSFEKYAYIKQNLGVIQESSFFLPSVNEKFFSTLHDFTGSSNPVLIRLKPK